MLKESAKWHKNKKNSIMHEFIIQVDAKVQEIILFTKNTKLLSTKQQKKI